jgi:hypothetical protein
MDGSPIAGLHPWENENWLPGGDDLPDWLTALRKRHLAAVAEYRTSIASVIDTSAQIEADARAWRRSVRDAPRHPTTPHDTRSAES